MWMVDPRVLCAQHLLGEHGELHKFRPAFAAGRRMLGRIGQVEPEAMFTRHRQLADEMRRRGYGHNSTYRMPSLAYLSIAERWSRVDVAQSLRELASRCPQCRRRIEDAC